MSGIKKSKNVKRKGSYLSSHNLFGATQSILASFGGKVNYPLPGVISKPGPLGQDFYYPYKYLACLFLTCTAGLHGRAGVYKTYFDSFRALSKE